MVIVNNLAVPEESIQNIRIMKNKFKPGSYIVTRDGFRGYIVKRLDYCNDMYEVRLPGGLTIRGGEEMEIDHIMEVNMDQSLNVPPITYTLLSVMKTILKQIVEELLNGDAFTQYNLGDVDWGQLERAVIREGYNKNSNIDLIKEAVIDLFDSVGYEEFGVEEIESTLN